MIVVYETNPVGVFHEKISRGVVGRKSGGNPFEVGWTYELDFSREFFNRNFENFDKLRTLLKFDLLYPNTEFI